MNRRLSRGKARVALLLELEHAVRRSSAQGVIYGQAVASVAGISGSDMDCLDILSLEGRVTAGRLAEVTGLTTGAITGVVDRLEKAGFVRRERDETDRRKVFIAPVPESIAKIGRLYEPMRQAMLKTWSSYSDAEIGLLLRFFEEGYKGMLAVTGALRARLEDTKAAPEVASKPPRVR